MIVQSPALFLNGGLSDVSEVVLPEATAIAASLRHLYSSNCIAPVDFYKIAVHKSYSKRYIFHFLMKHYTYRNRSGIIYSNVQV